MAIITVIAFRIKKIYYLTYDFPRHTYSEYGFENLVGFSLDLYIFHVVLD